MIEVVIDFINVQLDTLDIFITRHGLVEKVTEGDKQYPAEYCSKDEYKQVNLEDNVVYHRLTGPVTSEEDPSQAVSACDTYQTRTYPLRLVACVRKDILTKKNDDQWIDDKLAANISNVLSVVNNSTLNGLLNADTTMVSLVEYTTDRNIVHGLETTNIDRLPNFDYVYLAMDYEVEIAGSQDCFTNFTCAEPS